MKETKHRNEAGKEIEARVYSLMEVGQRWDTIGEPTMWMRLEEKVSDTEWRVRFPKTNYSAVIDRVVIVAKYEAPYSLRMTIGYHFSKKWFILKALESPETKPR